jgi:hypothetical protein
MAHERFAPVRWLKQFLYESQLRRYYQFDCGKRSRQTHPTSQIAPATIKAVIEINGTPSAALDA